MEVAPFFVGFHNLRSFVAIYIMSRFMHFFRNFFLAKIAFSATSHVFGMYGSCVPHNVSRRIRDDPTGFDLRCSLASQLGSYYSILNNKGP